MTLALQSLAATAESIDEVVVFHTAPRDAQIAEAIAALRRAFDCEEWLTAWRGRLRLVEITGAAGPLADMLAEEDFAQLSPCSTGKCET